MCSCLSSATHVLVSWKVDSGLWHGKILSTFGTVNSKHSKILELPLHWWVRPQNRTPPKHSVKSKKEATDPMIPRWSHMSQSFVWPIQAASQVERCSCPRTPVSPYAAWGWQLWKGFQKQLPSPWHLRLWLNWWVSLVSSYFSWTGGLSKSSLGLEGCFVIRLVLTSRSSKLSSRWSGDAADIWAAAHGSLKMVAHHLVDPSEIHIIQSILRIFSSTENSARFWKC